MLLQNWLLERPDGRRRADILHLVLISTFVKLASDRSPFELVSFGSSAEEIQELAAYMEDACAVFWTGLDKVEPTHSLCNELCERAEFLRTAMKTIRKTGLSIFSDEADIEADDEAVQSFVTDLETRLFAA